MADSKFKIGDRVRVIGNSNANNYGKGNTVTLLRQRDKDREISTSWRATRADGSEGNWLAEKDMELISSAPVSMPTPSKFKVGDTVKVLVRGSSRNNVGDIGTIKDTSGSSCEVRVPGGPISGIWHHSYDLELVTESTPKTPEYIIGKWYTGDSWSAGSICKFQSYRVREIYFSEAYINKIDKSDAKSWYKPENMRLATNEELSKWLPEDHKDNPDYMVKKSEPKDGYKFKVGDTVKIIANTNYSSNNVGDIGTITKDFNGNWEVTVPGRDTSHGASTYPHEMELVTLPLQTAYNTATIPYVDTSDYLVKYTYLNSDTITLQLIVDTSKEPKARRHSDVNVLPIGTLLTIDGTRWNKNQETICPEENRYCFNFPRSWFKVLGVHKAKAYALPDHLKDYHIVGTTTSYIPTHKTYRVKTRDEMIADGIMSNTQNYPSAWGSGMLQYFGKTIDSSEYSKIESITYAEDDFCLKSMGGYWFKKEELTTKPLPISYNTVSTRYNEEIPTWLDIEKSVQSKSMVDDLDYLDKISEETKFTGHYWDDTPSKPKLEVLLIPHKKRTII